MPNQEFHTLKAAIYPLANPVSEILGPVAGCAACITPLNHLDFFSLQTRRIVGSAAGPPGAFCHPGAGGLLEYDPGKQTLTRISVPGAVREQVLTFPANATLTGIGVGTDRSSPVTLALDLRRRKVLCVFQTWSIPARWCVPRKNGQVLLHEFPVYVLPWLQAGTNLKAGQI